MTPVEPAVVRIASSSLTAEFDVATGALSRLVAESGGWEIVAASGLGFAIRLPMEHRRNNVADSSAQDPPVWTKDSEDVLTARWERLRTPHSGFLDVSVEISVHAEADRLVFSMSIDNRSELVVEDVRFPRLDGVRPAGDDGQLSAFSYRYAAGRRRPLWPTFENVPGYYGVDHPTYLNEGEGTVGAPVAPFVLLDAQSYGLYMGVDEPSSELVAWHGQLHPGYGDSLLRAVPGGSMPGLPEVAGVRFEAAHVPYIAPGESRVLTPVALAAYDGDWHSGADIYVGRRTGWMGTAKAPEWAAEPHSWLQLHINSPEDELRMQFDDLVEVAKSCVRHGVSVIQLVGWNTGGQDRNNPSHDADARLGGPDALRRAIAACQAEGVRVVLFAKYTWADRSTERFRTELVHDAIKDPYGDYYMHSGYRYQTMVQLLDINTRRLVPMCFASESYLRVAADAHRGLVELGADGSLFDESLHHTPALLCFDESHGHRRGHPVYADDRRLIERFRQAAAGRGGDFLFAGEACYDWELEAYALSYHRSEDPDHVPLSRYLQPHAQLMTAVTGFDDRNMVNQALMYRYLISYEPYNFKGRLEDFPATVAYGQQIDSLRLALRTWLWDAEFRDTVGAVVKTAAGAPHHPYSVFRRPDGSCAVVVCNYDADAIAAVSVEVPDARGKFAVHHVGNTGWSPVSGLIEIPPRSAVVLVPAGEAALAAV